MQHNTVSQRGVTWHQTTKITEVIETFSPTQKFF